jgi:hypothetical protein
MPYIPLFYADGHVFNLFMGLAHLAWSLLTLIAPVEEERSWLRHMVSSGKAAVRKMLRPAL